PISGCHRQAEATCTTAEIADESQQALAQAVAIDRMALQSEERIVDDRRRWWAAVDDAVRRLAQVLHEARRPGDECDRHAECLGEAGDIRDIAGQRAGVEERATAALTIGHLGSRVRAENAQ